MSRRTLGVGHQRLYGRIEKKGDVIEPGAAGGENAAHQFGQSVALADGGRELVAFALKAFPPDEPARRRRNAQKSGRLNALSRLRLFQRCHRLPLVSPESARTIRP